ncbi:putative large secreted protein [Algibacter lectus]|uniref:Putative large secreted protein n=1 Tax=Algibacter lectus TaxID=221126 RepID=A0A090X5G1_9FLAO|nr:putative large secreted protein [Algibacter lectus]
MKIILNTFILICIGIGTCVAQNNNKNKLWYNAPAADWNEALPLGNGRLGAMVFGNPVNENIQLNENTLCWWSA